jgi:sugar lactone lactonase YvrE
MLVVLLCGTSNKLYAQKINLIAGNGIQGYSGDDSMATNAEMYWPYGIAVDWASNVFIADYANHRVRKVDAATGIITTIAGNGTAGFGGDNNLAVNAQLNYPKGVAVDQAGNVYIADQNNHRIRKVVATTGMITTVAGNGTGGFSGDGMPATQTQLNGPTSVVVDINGNLFIADCFNNRVRKVLATNDTIITVAGNGLQGYGGDDSAANNATLYYPYGIALDGTGNVYIADLQNQRVRKVNSTTGIITTIAGNGYGAGGIGGFSGDDSAATNARLHNPSSIVVDPAGDVFIADVNNNRIRKVSASTGIITTIAGDSTHTYAGDGGLAANARFNEPYCLALDHHGNLFVADVMNNRVRRIDSLITTLTPLTSFTENEINLYPNPNTGTFILVGNINTNSLVSVDVFSLLGKQVYHNTVPVSNGTINYNISLPHGLMNGLYFLKLMTDNGSKVFRVVLQR